jgi:hypothetical protein
MARWIDHAEDVQRVRMIGLRVEHPPAKPLRLAQAPGLEMPDGAGEGLLRRNISVLSRHGALRQVILPRN